MAFNTQNLRYQASRGQIKPVAHLQRQAASGGQGYQAPSYGQGLHNYGSTQYAQTPQNRLLGPPTQMGGATAPQPSQGLLGPPTQGQGTLNQFGLGFNQHQPAPIPQFNSQIQGGPPAPGVQGAPPIQFGGYGGPPVNYGAPRVSPPQPSVGGGPGPFNGMMVGGGMKADLNPATNPYVNDPYFGMQAPPGYVQPGGGGVPGYSGQGGEQGFGMPQWMTDFIGDSNQVPDYGNLTDLFGGGGVASGGFLTEVGQDPIDLSPAIPQHLMQQQLNNALGNNAAIEAEGLRTAYGGLPPGLSRQSPMMQGQANRLNLNRMVADTNAYRDIPFQTAKLNAENLVDRLRGLAQQRSLDIGAYTAQQNAMTNAINPLLLGLIGMG